MLLDELALREILESFEAQEMLALVAGAMVQGVLVAGVVVVGVLVVGSVVVGGRWLLRLGVGVLGLWLGASGMGCRFSTADAVGKCFSLDIMVGFSICLVTANVTNKA